MAASCAIQSLRSRGRCLVAAGTALFGVLAMLASAEPASSASVLNWRKQAPATSPPGRFSASMAYDTATGKVVLFGGLGSGNQLLNDTWTWNGSTWARQGPRDQPVRPV